MKRGNSFRSQLLFRFLLFMVAVLLVIGVFQYFFMRDFVYRNKAAGIQNQILSVPAVEWQEQVANVLNQGMHQSAFFFLPDSEVAFIDPTGNFQILSTLSAAKGVPPKLSSAEYQKAMRSGHGLNYKILDQATDQEQLLVLQPIVADDGVIGVIQVSVGTRLLEELLMRELAIFLPAVLLALAGGILLFIPVLKKTLVPLSNIVGTVEQIDAGNLAKRLPPDQGQMEMDRLASSFNRMLERLELSFKAEQEAKERMRQFIADASHELRTPLTSIHGFLEVLMRGAMDQPDKLHKSLQSMYTESERMRKLVQDLLLLAQLDRSPNIQREEGALNELVQEMEPQLRILAGARGVDLHIGAQLECRFDADKMKQVILNLFQNAIQNTDPSRGKIELSLTGTDGSAELVIADNGPGIPAQHLPHLFDRFYRSDASRTRKYGGAGLGLAITKSIVELHGGTIKVESEEGKGSRFIVRLPK